LVDFVEEASGGSSFEFSSAAFPVDEGAGAVTITVLDRGYSSRNGKLRNEHGMAVRGSDYRPASGVLSFDAGQTSKTFSVPILEDTIEESEDGQSDLSAPTGGASLGTPRVP